MNAFVPKGIRPAMVTPMDAAGRIQEKALSKLVNHLIDGGVHGLFPVGSQGEFFPLAQEEKMAVLKCVIDETASRDQELKRRPRAKVVIIPNALLSLPIIGGRRRASEAK